jgi:hypothetical protein
MNAYLKHQENLELAARAMFATGATFCAVKESSTILIRCGGPEEAVLKEELNYNFIVATQSWEYNNVLFRYRL